MEYKLNKTEAKQHRIFNDMNFVKNTSINFHYSDCMDKVKNVSNCLDNFIDLIDSASFKTNKSLKKKNINSLKTKKYTKKKSINTIYICKPNKLFDNSAKDIKERPKNIFMKNFNVNKDDKNRNFHFRPSESMVIKRDKLYNKFNYNFKKAQSKSQSTSDLIGKSYKRGESTFYTTKNSMKNLFNNNSSTHKKYNKTMLLSVNKGPRPQTVKSTHSIDDYFQKNNKYSSYTNTSRYFSNSLYRTNTNLVIDNGNYKKLKPKFLKQLLKNSKNIKKSYKKELNNVYLLRKTRELMSIVEKEIKMKEPEYYKKILFNNIINVKKTVEIANKMREELRYRINTNCPGNENNKVYMRKNNANLIRFSDAICHMKDINFYKYRKILKDLYPKLSKNVFKNKYEISPKNLVNKKRMQDNEMKINKLISKLHKY